MPHAVHLGDARRTAGIPLEAGVLAFVDRYRGDVAPVLGNGEATGTREQRMFDVQQVSGGKALPAGVSDPVAVEGRRFMADVRELPGVTRVFPPASGTSRWFAGPVTDLRQEGVSVRAWITIGVDRHESVRSTVGLVDAYVRARLLERGFDFIEVRVRVALLA